MARATQKGGWDEDAEPKHVQLYWSHCRFRSHVQARIWYSGSMFLDTRVADSQAVIVTHRVGGVQDLCFGMASFIEYALSKAPTGIVQHCSPTREAHHNALTDPHWTRISKAPHTLRCSRDLKSRCQNPIETPVILQEGLFSSGVPGMLIVLQKGHELEP